MFFKFISKRVGLFGAGFTVITSALVQSLEFLYLGFIEPQFANGQFAFGALG